MQKLLLAIAIVLSTKNYAQFSTTFELTKGKETATYGQCIKFYASLAKKYPQIKIKNFDTTDAGYPLQLVTYKKSNRKNEQKEMLTILINNGIHPGEPDGIDASMMLLRDIVQGKVAVDDNVQIAIIPVYNIGGALNRNSTTRVNQNGPHSYGFRGNAQNLDLNRDFIKCDSKDAKAFVKIFQYLQPHIFIDNHVSDGADYQHTMTLLTTQHNKMGGVVGEYLHNNFEPMLYAKMQQKGWEMCPYVNFEEALPQKGWNAFYDAPRYSSGYAALFGTMAFVPETHMLKPYADRVKSTYDLMVVTITAAAEKRVEILKNKLDFTKAVAAQKTFALSWKTDTSKFQKIIFKGYETAEVISAVTNLPIIQYQQQKPFTKEVNFYNYFAAKEWVNKPKAYEKHHRNYDVQLEAKEQLLQFFKGDYIVFTGQPTDRYLIETLEPKTDDSFFSWNFFDAILQQKEGYSNYRWDTIAASFLRNNPAVQAALNAKRKADTLFSKNADAQYDFVHKQSPYYEKAHMRYPVVRLMH